MTEEGRSLFSLETTSLSTKVMYVPSNHIIAFSRRLGGKSNLISEMSEDKEVMGSNRSILDLIQAQDSDTKLQ